jgi:hypothetical protein
MFNLFSKPARRLVFHGKQQVAIEDFYPKKLRKGEVATKRTA